MTLQQLKEANEDREFAFSDKEFSFLAELANKKTGIVLSAGKKNMVYSRLTRRLRQLGLSSFADYCKLVMADSEGVEIGNMVNAITTNLTKFFRESHHFEHLHDNVILPFSKRAGRQDRLRIWSAGCSAGMEAYSIAMTIKSAINDILSWDARILATDIDTNMLNTGRSGRYDISQLANIAEKYRKDVAVSDCGDEIMMSDYLRKMIAFKQLNLLEDWPMTGMFDAVFCRNVVIYFDKDTQRVLFNRIANLIKHDGCLYIGHSENLHNITDRFELIGRTIYRKIR
ncbi:MAG: CheR family methyltransferase [Rickettsiales bacterium]